MYTYRWSFLLIHGRHFKLSFHSFLLNLIADEEVGGNGVQVFGNDFGPFVGGPDEEGGRGSDSRNVHRTAPKPLVAFVLSALKGMTEAAGPGCVPLLLVLLCLVDLLKDVLQQINRERDQRLMFKSYLLMLTIFGSCFYAQARNR
jgi:hypothetical protein